MKIVGIGGIIGMLVGISAAEWIGSPNDAAYYSVVVLIALLGSIIAKLCVGGSGPS